MTIRSARVFGPALSLSLGLALAGCSGGSTTLSPQPRLSAVAATATPASTPTAAASPTATPTSPGATATPSATPSPTGSASAITVVTSNQYNTTYVEFPMPGSSCPSSYYAETITATEAGYSGAFTATSNAPSDFTVAPASTPGTFTVTDLNAATFSGTNTITVADSNHNTASVNVVFNIDCL